MKKYIKIMSLVFTSTPMLIASLISNNNNLKIENTLLKNSNENITIDYTDTQTKIIDGKPTTTVFKSDNFPITNNLVGYGIFPIEPTVRGYVIIALNEKKEKLSDWNIGFNTKDVFEPKKRIVIFKEPRQFVQEQIYLSFRRAEQINLEVFNSGPINFVNGSLSIDPVYNDDGIYYSETKTDANIWDRDKKRLSYGNQELFSILIPKDFCTTDEIKIKALTKEEVDSGQDGNIWSAKISRSDKERHFCGIFRNKEYSYEDFLKTETDIYIKVYVKDQCVITKKFKMNIFHNNFIDLKKQFNRNEISQWFVMPYDFEETQYKNSYNNVCLKGDSTNKFRVFFGVDKEYSKKIDLPSISQIMKDRKTPLTAKFVDENGKEILGYKTKLTYAGEGKNEKLDISGEYVDITTITPNISQNIEGFYQISYKNSEGNNRIVYQSSKINISTQNCSYDHINKDEKISLIENREKQIGTLLLSASDSSISNSYTGKFINDDESKNEILINISEDGGRVREVYGKTVKNILDNEFKGHLEIYKNDVLFFETTSHEYKICFQKIEVDYLFGPEEEGPSKLSGESIRTKEFKIKTQFIDDLNLINFRFVDKNDESKEYKKIVFLKNIERDGEYSVIYLDVITNMVEIDSTKADCYYLKNLKFQVFFNDKLCYEKNFDKYCIWSVVAVGEYHNTKTDFRDSKWASSGPETEQLMKSNPNKIIPSTWFDAERNGIRYYGNSSSYLDREQKNWLQYTPIVTFQTSEKNNYEWNGNFQIRVGYLELIKNGVELKWNNKYPWYESNNNIVKNISKVDYTFDVVGKIRTLKIYGFWFSDYENYKIFLGQKIYGGSGGGYLNGISAFDIAILNNNKTDRFSSVIKYDEFLNSWSDIYSDDWWAPRHPPRPSNYMQ